MIRRPPRSTRTDTLFPYTTLFRSISIATVYRTLSLFDEMNIVQRHDFNETFARFEVNVAHHHHLIDVGTGEVVEFQNEPLEILKARIRSEERRVGKECVRTCR